MIELCLEISGWTFDFQDFIARNEAEHYCFGEYFRDSNIPKYLSIQRGRKGSFISHTCRGVSHLLC